MTVIARSLVAALTHRVRPDLIRYFEQACAQWQAGNEVGSNIQLAFARIPRLGGWDDAWRLFLAGERLLDGLPPAALLKELGFAADQIALLKYPGQPRVPAGNGDQSGRFGPARQDGAQVTPVFFREPGDVPSKHDPDEPPPEEQSDQKPVPNPVPGIKNPGPGGVTDDMLPAPFRSAPQFQDPATGAKKPPGSSAPAGQTGDVTGPTSKPKSSDSGSRGGRPPWSLDPNFRDEDPQRCSAPVKDIGHGATPEARDYEDRGHLALNQDNPLHPGQAIFYHNIYFDDCAQNDDPQGRWKAGDLIEFKANHTHLTGQPWWTKGGKVGLLQQAENRNIAVAGTGRRTIYLTREQGDKEYFEGLFEPFTNIKVYHFPIDPPYQRPVLKAAIQEILSPVPGNQQMTKSPDVWISAGLKDEAEPVSIIAARTAGLLRSLGKINPLLSDWFVMRDGDRPDKLILEPGVIADMLVWTVEDMKRQDPYEPVRGYYLEPFTNGYENKHRPEDFKLLLAAGKPLYNQLFLQTARGVVPDPRLFNFLTYKQILFAIDDAFEIEEAVAAPLALRQILGYPQDDKRPLTPGWMTLLPPPLAAQITPPPQAITQTRDDGSLFIAATEDAFDVENPAHLAVCKAIKEALEPINRWELFKN